MTNEERILSQIEDLEDYQKVSLWNEFCSANYYDDYIRDNDDEFLNMSFESVADFAQAASRGAYDYDHEYVMFDAHGDLESFDDPEPYIDFDSLADFVANNYKVARDYGIDIEEDEDEE